MAKKEDDRIVKGAMAGVIAVLAYLLWKRKCPVCDPVVTIVEHGDSGRARPAGRISVPRGESLTIEIDNGYLDALEVQLDGLVIEDGTYDWGSYFQSEGARIVLTSVTSDHRIDLTYTPSQVYLGRP
jgi:hypothetical protein